MFLMILRSSRPVILPLWGIHLGLEPAAIATIFGVSAGVDSALFYLAGSIMDRFGRKWSGAPSVVLMAIAFLLLPLSGGFTSLMGVGILMGLGNAISSGYVATLGSDLAPTDGRAEFLGMWQFIVNIGVTAGPLALGGLTAVASVGVAASILGVIGLAGSVYIALVVPETLVRSVP